MSAYFVPHLLQGRRFLITGATGGAGRAVAREISRVGGLCVLAGRDPEKLGKTLEETHGGGHTTLTLMDSFGHEFRTTHPYDGIVHCAGEEVVGPLSLARPEQAMKASYNIALSILAAASRRKDGILRDGGSIVLMSSVAAVRGTAGMAVYSASKAAVEGLARAAALELAPRRIRVNCIRAGAFASPMHTRIAQRLTPEQQDEYAGRHPLGIGRAEDVAHLALYLLSDASRWMTGACVPLDGGYTAK